MTAKPVFRVLGLLRLTPLLLTPSRLSRPKRPPAASKRAVKGRHAVRVRGKARRGAGQRGGGEKPKKTPAVVFEREGLCEGHRHAAPRRHDPTHRGGKGMVSRGREEGCRKAGQRGTDGEGISPEQPGRTACSRS